MNRRHYSFGFRLKRNVAIKILVSESSPEDHELKMLKLLSDGPLDHPGRKNTMQMLEHFDHVGPNGLHRCLVLELLGPNISLEAESYDSDRLPGCLAWEVTKQTTQALDYIHKSGIAHGGLFHCAPASTILICNYWQTYIQATLSLQTQSCLINQMCTFFPVWIIQRLVTFTPALAIP